MDLNRSERRRASVAGGFSTIEVLVTLLVAGIVFVSLYAGVTSGFAFVQLARENLRATQIMEEKMETIRLYTWDQINQAGFIPTNFVQPFYPLNIANTNSMTYTGMLTIASTPFTEYYTDDLKQFTIDLTWKSANVVRHRSMNTIVARYGLQQYIY